MRIAAIAATLFVVLNLVIGRYWWALAFGALAVMWFATARAIERRARERGDRARQVDTEPDDSTTAAISDDVRSGPRS